MAQVFYEGELYVGDVPGGQWPCYTIMLTSAGLASRTYGEDAIACIAACNSGSTAGSWNARVECVYDVACLDELAAESDLTKFFAGVTSDYLDDFSKMLVSQAVTGTSMSTAGNAETALFPWVTSASPVPATPWTSPPAQVIFTFGADMEQVTRPFGVGGVGIVKSGAMNGWTSATSAKVEVYYGWESGTVIVGVAGSRLKSTKGIPLYAGKADFVLNYSCVANSYPPAASVNAFIPTLHPNGGVAVEVDMMSLRGTESLWVERADGLLIGDTLRVESLAGHTFTVLDPAGTAEGRYRLLEREYDGDMFLRASDGVSVKTPVVKSSPSVDKVTARLFQSRAPVEAISSGAIGMVICPDAFASTAQIYANFWTSAGKPVDVVPLSVAGNTTSSLHAYIGQRYAEGVRYVLLAGSADEHLWFDDASKWPDLPGTNDWRWVFDDYHTPGGYWDLASQPARDLIPMWFAANSDFDNMSYWTPYFTTDYYYRSDFPGLRVGRVPAYSNDRFLAWVNKNIAYCQSGSVAAWSDDVGIWSYCHGADGNSGPVMQALTDDFRSQLPGTLVQHALIDTNWTQTARQTVALADWNAGRGIIYMLGTSSTPYKPVHFFSKASGWHVGQLATDRHPVVIGSSCGIGTHDMAVDPTYGDHFATEVLTGHATRGTPFVIGPSRGTWSEGNRQMMEKLNKDMSVSPVPDLGTAFMVAQDEVIANGLPSARQTALSYQLLGDPLAPLPGRSVVTEGGSKPRWPTALLQNHPNPFNPSTTFRFTLSTAQRTILRVYGVSGQRVATVIDEVREPGMHEITWQPSGLPSGVYFYKLDAGSFSAARKMVLLK